nr:hypothetical protein [Candidatus Woesebacteria bacterium]
GPDRRPADADDRGRDDPRKADPAAARGNPLSADRGNRELAGTYITISKQTASGPKPETSETNPASTDGNIGSIGNKNEENMEEMVRDTLF